MVADSDEVAQAFRDDVAHGSGMMSPGFGASLADDLWHSNLKRSIVGSGDVDGGGVARR
jgi:hypothetical protein